MTGFKDAQVQLSRYQNFAGIPCVSNKTLIQQAFLLRKQSHSSHISKLLKANIRVVVDSPLEFTSAAAVSKNGNHFSDKIVEPKTFKNNHLYFI